VDTPERAKIKFWSLVLVLGLVGGTAGGLAAAAANISWDRAVALATSLGTLLAAGTTLLTVREMRQGRIAVARAHVTTFGPDLLLNYTWHVAPRNVPPEHTDLRILVRNASQGVAQNIHARWKIDLPLTVEQLSAINSLLPTGKTIAIDNGSYVVQFNDSSTTNGTMAVNGDTLIYLGDLGPAQETYMEVPRETGNYAFLKSLVMLQSVLAENGITDQDQAMFRLTFTHDSPYERGLSDTYIARFVIEDHSFVGRNRRVSFGRPGSEWRDLNVSLRLTQSSSQVEAIPQVVVP
jgi:hypothetical protein